MTYEFDKVGFAKRLLALTKAKAEKNAMLAFKCDLPIPTFDSYIYRQNIPTAGNLAQLCVGLEVSADWLLFGVDRNTDQQNSGQNGKFSRYRFMQNGLLPIAEFSGFTEQVLENVNDYIANYKADIPAVVEMHLNDRWERLAWIGVNHVGGSHAG